ncbi:glycosyltransferase [Gelidibacter algens]|uniref:glycosyltransferase n=1 Tax=Gelidibacter algens TaxID=49280 RepID=UPI0011B93C0F|nr:glycosyltransferase [Gelidibacter algens]
MSRVKGNRKKVLIVIDWFLPGTMSGGPVRSYANLIEHLTDEFEFLVVTRDSDFGSDRPYDTVISNTWTEFNDYTKVFYLSNDNVKREFLKELFQNTEFDIAYINGIYSWYFSILPIILLKPLGKAIIVSARGMLNPQAFSVKGFKKKSFLKIASVFKLYNNVSFHATNADEASFIKSIIGDKTLVQIAPNLPRKLRPSFQQRTQKQNPVSFINLARVSVEKGTLIMLKTLSNIEQPLKLDLYGPIHDEVYWTQCQTVISQLPKHINVTYKGVLPSEKIPETLTDYDFFVLLSEGENFGHAIIEALSSGLPVLISDKTPWKALESKLIGWDVDIKNQYDIIKAFNEAIKMSEIEYSKCSKAAFEYAEAFIDNPEVLKQNKALFLNA